MILEASTAEDMQNVFFAHFALRILFCSYHDIVMWEKEENVPKETEEVLRFK